MAGTPTWANIVDRLQAFADADNSARIFAQGTALGKYTTIEGESLGDYGPVGNPAYTEGQRSLLSAALGPELLRAGLDPLLLDAGKVIGSPGSASSMSRLVRDFFNYMKDHGSENRVESRDITFGTPSPDGGNTGDGSVSRLTVDEFGLPLEACTAESKTAICREDSLYGPERGAELFEIHGEAPSPDQINRFVQGSGIAEAIRVRHAGTGEGGSLLVNSSFDEALLAGETTGKVPGWVAESGDSGLSLNSDIFIAPPGSADSESNSLAATADFKLTQSIEEAGFTADVAQPYIISIRYKTSGGCDGSLTLRMGSQTVAVADLTGASGGWDELIFTPGTGLWPANFYEDRMDIEIEMASNTTGTLQIDHVIFAAMDQVDGTWYHLRGGATPFQLDDSYTWTDSEGTVGKIQQMWIAAGLGYLPSSTSPTIADP